LWSSRLCQHVEWFLNSDVSEANTASIFGLLRKAKYEYTGHLENQMLRETYDCKKQKIRRERGI
jgi:hypothetical protein